MYWNFFMHYEWNDSKARRIHVVKILMTWFAAIAASTLPVILAVNALTF